MVRTNPTQIIQLNDGDTGAVPCELKILNKSCKKVLYRWFESADRVSDRFASAAVTDEGDGGRFKSEANEEDGGGGTDDVVVDEDTIEVCGTNRLSHASYPPIVDILSANKLNLAFRMLSI